jgi:hypothetical protein
MKRESFRAKGYLVRYVWRDKLNLLDILQLVISMSGICMNIKVSNIDTNEYQIECYDMFNNLTFEMIIVVHNPYLKSFLIKLITAIQDYQKSQKK